MQMKTNEKQKKTWNEDVSVNPIVRNYKDTIFRMIFRDKRELLTLYNAVNGTHYDNPEELEITTLENAIYMNDYEAVKDLTEDFKYCEDMIDDFLTSDAYVLTINDFLNCDVVERYPMVWFEDVYEYRIALKLPDELV